MKKRIRARAAAMCVLTLLALLAASSPAAAKPKPINGKLSKRGYTVIALAANGKATSVVAKHRTFRLRPPAKRVTLQLRAKNGVYAGPIVVGKAKKGKRAIVGVRAGAKLGKVKVKRRKGYAKLKRNLPKKFVDPKRQARAKKGVPIGAGNFGRVRSKHTKGGVPGDRDLDGIPDALDVDDNGNLILDNFERSTGARASQAANEFGLSSGFSLFIEQTVNANAAALTRQDIDAALRAFGVLNIEILPGDSAELDCGAPVPAGLPYCAPGGTGAAAFTGAPGAPPPLFPPCCDPDNDGFGTLSPTPSNFARDFFLAHRATTAQIGTGDVLIERVTTGGVESQFPAALQMVLATVPALVSYSDTATPTPDSATVSYPVAAPMPPSTSGGPGSEGNPFPVDGPGGNLDLTLRFWRPQRTPISGETCPPPVGRLCSPIDWIDIGGLSYQVALGYTPELPPPWAGAVKPCPQSALHDPTPNLTVSTVPPGLATPPGGFTDGAADQPANPGNTLGYSVNVTQCIAALNDELHSLGVSQSISWDPGETQEFIFLATNLNDNAQQHVYFKRP
jgi:hypothetical protein